MLSRLLFCLALVFGLAQPAVAGALGEADVKRAFPFPYIVGERDPALPVWPIFKQNATSDELVAYVFESIDFAPVPGFSGTPLNLLVALKPDGGFLAARLISHHEPVFLEGLGEEPLIAFIRQYEGLSLKQTIRIAGGGRRVDASGAVIDGVSKATASVRIVNESIVAAALHVARAKLGYASNADPARAVRPREDNYEPLTYEQLIARGLLRRYRVTNAEAERAFAGTEGAGIDAEARRDPEGLFLDMHVAYLNPPLIGRNIFGDDHYRRLMGGLREGEHAFLLLSSGRYSFEGPGFTQGAVMDRASLRQSGLPIEARDFAFRRAPSLVGLPVEADVSVMKIFAQAGLDPSSPFDIVIRAIREKGQVYPQKYGADIALPHELPGALFIFPPPPEATGWRAVWAQRASDIATLVAGLVILTALLFAQKRLTARPRLFSAFRVGFLVYTLFFIGFWAQGQLSIVNLVGALKAIVGQGEFGFLLYDPPTLILWAYVAPTLLIWGRGTFCGWLCPFGALQELASLAARPLRPPSWRIGPRAQRALRLVKYGFLVAILAAALHSSALAEKLAEVEPFKTSITLVFLRSTPFVLYAVGLILLGLFHYKFFCRYLCPLGASLAVGGLARRWDWIQRRKQCGSPCQLCKARCRYDAIDPRGAVRYDECFQCMDCVLIHNDRTQCVPLVLATKKRREMTA